MAFGKSYKNEFMRYMSRQGVKYLEKDHNLISIRYKMDNLTVELLVHFDEDGDNYASIRSYSIGSFPDNSEGKALYTCNEMNKRYKWAKFYLDNDQDIAVAADAILDINSVGPALIELCMRLSTIIDETYPIFMKIRWS